MKESAFFDRMKLKALVYQQKEWNPLQLSTGFPVFPVENITEEALAVWKLHAEEVLLITPTDAGIQAAVRAHMAVAAYADPAFANCIIHCAYTVMGNITVDRYFNKIVLSNPGTMLVSKEEFEEGGHSVCRKLRWKCSAF